jgi:hypothetical protein
MSNYVKVVMSFLNFIVFAGGKKLAKKFCAKPTYVTIIL